MTDRERLVYIIENEGLTSKQFCEKVGIGAGTISNITSGRNRASLEVLQKVRQRFPKYSASWLYEGIGEPQGLQAQVQQTPDPTGDSVQTPNQTDSVQMPADLFEMHIETPEATHTEAVSPVADMYEDKANESNKEYEKAALISQRQHKEELPDLQAAHQHRSIERIVIFYSDGTYEER